MARLLCAFVMAALALAGPGEAQELKIALAAEPTQYTQAFDIPLAKK